MTEMERLVADYAGMGLSAGRHPMALKRDELAMRGILRARGFDIGAAGPPRPRGRHGHHAAAARHRQGFLFLTLEDETGIANIIVRRTFSRATASSSSRNRSSSSTACSRIRTVSRWSAPSRSRG